MRYYPLADWPSRDPRSKADHRAVLTGETRPPRAGEWYVSGAIPEAYRMPNDSTIPQRIARIVRVRIVKMVREAEPMG